MEQFEEIAKRAKKAAVKAQGLSSEIKNEALVAVAKALKYLKVMRFCLKL